MKKIFSVVLLFAFAFGACAPKPTPEPTSTPSPSATPVPPTFTMTPTSTVTPKPQSYLSDLTPQLAKVGYWNFSIGAYPETDGNIVKGQPITSYGHVYRHGIFAPAPSFVQYYLGGLYRRFSADIFIDEKSYCPGTDGAKFVVLLDGEEILGQYVPGAADATEPIHIDVDVTGGETLLLYADPGPYGLNDCDMTIWGNPILTRNYAGTPTPMPVTAPIYQQPLMIKVVKQFTRALTSADIPVSENALLSTSSVRSIETKDGILREIAVVHLDPDPNVTGEYFEGDYPLLVKQDGQWQEAGLRFFAEASGLEMTAPLSYAYVINPSFPQKLLLNNVTQVTASYGMGAYCVFNGFTDDDWRRVLDNWDDVEAQMDEGKIPEGYPYQWTKADAVVDFAVQHNLKIRGAGLLRSSPDDIPMSILHGDFSREELEKLMEFMIKTRVLRYRGKITIWDGADESASTMAFPQESLWNYWYNKMGGREIVAKSFIWIHEADPNAKIIFVDIIVTKERFFQLSHVNQEFFGLLKYLQSQDVPIDGVDIESNMWIYNPVREEYMAKQLAKIQDMGLDIYPPETTVFLSEVYPVWGPPYPKQVTLTDNKLVAQAKLYDIVLRAHLDVGALGFGLGDLTDDFSWFKYDGHPDANAMVFDEYHQPKLAYFVLLKTFYEYVENMTPAKSP